ncbi:excinuclease ABC subunit UvrA [Zhenhengia yiwuensis]|uniref:UvrABC system protein A n=1 Tax=Zhenhengia yiwuensis TaxID=2763666 RepID=A0A926EI40_9FIRM|nr:excinuclease ABC subunit UvrA [Zhenhengia yiwuensis]MBC8578612.1 excinuclease ABC subunit UvrA [Zhenhengia yiwuensis]MBS5800983.1 excinuclease ABC subunit UvrA [Clostridiales bacterium]
MKNKIVIKGAREHNLKNIDLELNRDQLIVFTGLSGSGKSSLAFDTIYAEGQRRYVESLSAYARQFLGQMEKPEVDYISGLSPAISIDQKTTSKNPRSTVGTVTEIYDYLRLLFARVGVPHCPNCGKEIKKQTIDQMVDQLMELPERTKVQLLAPVVRGRKGKHEKVLETAVKQGYIRARIDGEVVDLTEAEIDLDKNKKHSIDIVVDRLVIKEGIGKRLTDSIETVMKQSGGLMIAEINGVEEMNFSQSFSCPDCQISIEEIEPRLFSFNNPFGACPTCTGLGEKLEVDPELVIPNPELTIRQGAIAVIGWGSIGNPDSYAYALFDALMKKYHFDLDTPFKELPEDIQNMILYGTDGEKVQFTFSGEYGTRNYDYAFEGVVANTKRRYEESSSESMRDEYEIYMTSIPCKTCKGARLKPEALAVTIGDKNINQVTSMSIGDLRTFFLEVELTDRQKAIGVQILKEINARLGFLVDVGLDYLTLSRSSGTLSGGEAQRIRLATQIGSGLVGVLYILDEPSIGLHQRDNERLIQTLVRLRDLGNTLIVVEHDEDTMHAADWIVDIGPGAGEHGGNIISSGPIDTILACEESETGAYLSGRKQIEVPEVRRKGNGNKIKIVGAKENNLKNVSVDIPLGTLTCITGVSGSGKSTLINEILLKRLSRDLNRAKCKPGAHRDIKGLENLDKVIHIDQSPIGRTPRSNPATYVGVFDMIRDVFAQTQEAKMKGYQKGRFSFNVKGGRCEACRGDGMLKIEMHFLPDVYVPCEVCKGKRYNRETLEVKYKEKTISDVLDMTVEEALKFFENFQAISRKLQTLYDVGLGYIRLGQSSTTLSGGEAQRVKLATELSRRGTGKTMYILDEPTTGLHFADVHKLVGILDRLVENGNTVVVIEHNLDVIKTADYIIDLGPEGGSRGGEIVATGTPEKVARVEGSYTGKFLKKILNI